MHERLVVAVAGGEVVEVELLVLEHCGWGPRSVVSLVVLRWPCAHPCASLRLRRRRLRRGAAWARCCRPSRRPAGRRRLRRCLRCHSWALHGSPGQCRGRRGERSGEHTLKVDGVDGVCLALERVCARGDARVGCRRHGHARFRSPGAAQSESETVSVERLALSRCPLARLRWAGLARAEQSACGRTRPPTGAHTRRRRPSRSLPRLAPLHRSTRSPLQQRSVCACRSLQTIRSSTLTTSQRAGSSARSSPGSTRSVADRVHLVPAAAR